MDDADTRAARRVTLGLLAAAVPDAMCVTTQAAAVHAPRDLVLTVPAAGGPLVSWAFRLDAVGRGRTRLLVRLRRGAERA